MEKNGTKINLVPLDAEFSAEQHIQNPLKSPLGNLLNIYFIFLLSNIKEFRFILLISNQHCNWVIKLAVVCNQTNTECILQIRGSFTGVISYIFIL